MSLYLNIVKKKRKTTKRVFKMQIMENYQGLFLKASRSMHCLKLIRKKYFSIINQHPLVKLLKIKLGMKSVFTKVHGGTIII